MLGSKVSKLCTLRKHVLLCSTAFSSNVALFCFNLSTKHQTATKNGKTSASAFKKSCMFKIQIVQPKSGNWVLLSFLCCCLFLSHPVLPTQQMLPARASPSLLHVFLSVVLSLVLQWLSKSFLPPFSSWSPLTNLQAINLGPASFADGIVRSLPNYLGRKSWASWYIVVCTDPPWQLISDAQQLPCIRADLLCPRWDTSTGDYKRLWEQKSFIYPTY